MRSTAAEVAMCLTPVEWRELRGSGLLLAVYRPADRS